MSQYNGTGNLSAGTRIALGFGVAVPVLYFGAQIATAPFFPGYSFVTDAASLLGSDRSGWPLLFNLGAMATGVATIASAYGFVRAFRAAGTHWIIAWLLAIALVSAGIGSVWAGCFPLPSPRHAIGAAGGGLFFLPVLFLAAFWTMRGATAVRVYLIVNLIAFSLIAAVMSGAAGIDYASSAGAMQRAIACVVMIPIGVTAANLLRRR